MHQKFHEEIIKNNRVECNKNISKAMSKPESKTNIHDQELKYILENGEVNKDYVICQICGFKGKNLTTHINRKHNINLKNYNKLYPNVEIICENYRDKLRDALALHNPNDNPESISKMKETKAGTKPERSKKAKLQFLNGERPIPKNHGWGNGGCREDLGHYVRSNWEANFARLLNYKGIQYEFEKVIPLYDQNGELIYNYLVDFYLPQYDSYIEIKGKWEELAMEKVELFRQQYNEKFVIIEGPTYYKINKMFKRKISHWE